MITLPKKNRSGPSLGSYEIPHIFKDPPKSIHTRKKERVEAGDITHKIRENPDRISENILQFARGVNPSVSVSYSNHGGGSRLTCTSNQRQVSNAYKVNKKFVPPTFRQEDLLPLSRQRRDLTSVHTKINAPYFVRNDTEYKIDYEPLRSAVHVNYNMPTYSTTQSDFCDNVKLDKNKLLHSVQTNNVMPTNIYTQGKYDKKIKLQQKTHATNVMALPSKNILVNSQNSHDNQLEKKGIIIKPSIAVQTNPGMKQSLTFVDLDNQKVTKSIKETPLRTMLHPTFSVSFYNPETQRYSDIKLTKNLKEYVAAQANLSAPIQLPLNNNKTVKLKDYNWTVHRTNIGSSLILTTTKHPEIFLNRTSNMMSTQSGVNPSLRLNKDVNVRELQSQLQTSVNTSVNPSLRLNKDVNVQELKNVLPQTCFNSSIKSTVKYNAPQNVSKNRLNNKQNISVNTRVRNNNVANHTNREYSLRETLNVGGFSNHGVDRGKYMNKNDEPTKMSTSLQAKMNLKNAMRLNRM